MTTGVNIPNGKRIQKRIAVVATCACAMLIVRAVLVGIWLVKSEWPHHNT